jgi:hypothetical protein
MEPKGRLRLVDPRTNVGARFLERLVVFAVPSVFLEPIHNNARSAVSLFRFKFLAYLVLRLTYRYDCKGLWMEVGLLTRSVLKKLASHAIIPCSVEEVEEVDSFPSWPST